MLKIFVKNIKRAIFLVLLFCVGAFLVPRQALSEEPGDPPAVISIIRTDADPTNAGSVNFTVVFSEEVTGLGTGNFTLSGDVQAPSVSSVSPGPSATYNVTVDTGLGDGTVGLDLSDADGITDTDDGLPVSNSPYVGDEFYTIDKTAPSGYTVSIDLPQINNSNKDAFSFTFADAEAGATYYYSIDDGSEVTPPVNGNGNIITATDQITGINVSSLADGTLTLSVFLTDTVGNSGDNSNDTVEMNTAGVAEVYVDDNYSAEGENDGHTWQTDAFNTISDGIAVVSDGGTVTVAAGIYASSLTIDKSLSLIGPGLSGDYAFVDVECDIAAYIIANDVSINGFVLDDVENSQCDAVVSIGEGVTGAAVTNNQIFGGYAGVQFGANSDTTVTDNNIYGDYYGIAVNAGEQVNATVTGNNIHDNSTGVYISPSVIITSMTFQLNTITGNTSPATGIHNEADTSFNAGRNWWGSSTGPTHSSNPEGAGDTITDLVLYRPYYTDSEKTTLSTLAPAADSFNPTDLFTSGSFSIAGSDPNSTTSITVNEDVTLSVTAGGGISSVELPSGTVITKNGGGSMDATMLSSANTSTSDLSGFTTGTVVDGAMQWGIPDLGLEFSQAITLNIFVGTSLNGQTLSVVRSANTSSGWTSDGIVEPATCVVASGICTFQTTKASYYATTHETASGSDSNQNSSPGSSSGSPVPSCGDQAPQSVPNLFQIDAGSTQATLYFAPVSGSADKYFIAYGYTTGDSRFGAEINQSVSTGVISYTVDHLNPNTGYYFKVRAGNGCMPGNWGNEMKITTPKQGIARGIRYYKDFLSRIISFLPRHVSVLGTSVTSKKDADADSRNTCEYTVQPGDSLWGIASSQLGSGTKYMEILEANRILYPSLSTHTLLQIGWKLKVGC
ncbi:hypothetical protein A2Z33_02675 [Candidatus Gottesmanbacteria bacterium RBG_16_52_11]|uniref:Fibronectin type-III domain-containing protein n=1 Tax=Candidatus Gottesmanbacteria bacterium RBG_16_52_11 TaxID=1798374 RepID=A0A1F5YMJ0_9BACT|nr:MAG: hypothetical protein A2Z33_02675 [Candidatus Gottesmanbacteria bacterium RBG_16_52_11]